MIIHSGNLFLVLSAIIVFFSNVHFGAAKKETTSRQHWIICALAVLVGCAIRFWALDSLVTGVNAEEALNAVQAKSLWQTGGFLFHGKLTAQFQQWAGESNGPLYAFLTAPFVGIMGMSTLSVRLPMTLMSCVAMLAAYGIGKELSGKKAGRWMLIIYALCPAFILDARLAASANVAVFLAPVAFYALLRGLRTNGCLYAGMILMGLLAYAYDIYFFIVPVVIAAAVVAAKAAGVKTRHIVVAALLGVLVYLPAFLTLWVNLCGLDGFVLFGLIEIPRLQEFVKADFIWSNCENLVQLVEAIRAQMYSVFFGSIFQEMRHANISSGMFVPTGIYAFYTMSIPVVLLGGLSILCSLADGKNKKDGTAVKRAFLAFSGWTVLIVNILVGNRGFEDLQGGTNVFDYSALFLFFALLMATALCRIERKSALGKWGVLGLFAASCVMFCVFLFGGTYRDHANTHFQGMDEVCSAAVQKQEETGYKIYITSTVYPHIDPSAAAEMMYLYSSDADMATVAEKRGKLYEAAFLSGIEHLEPNAIYIVRAEDVYNCDLEGWLYEESGYGEFVLLTPLNER